MDQLFKQIDRGYSGGYRQKLQTQKDTLNNQLAEQVKAKRFRAFQLNQEIAHLESQKQGIDEKKIQHLRYIFI